MTRARVGGIAMLCLLLVDPLPATDVDASPAPSGVLASGSRVSLDPAAVERIVAGVNPSLSPREGTRIAGAVLRYAAKYRLDADLVTAVLLVESAARPGARSPKGALGLMQVMPHMRAPLGLAGNATTIESNIEAGCLILAGNIRRLGEERGVLAYFWGSQIRGVSYLSRVRAARAAVQRLARS